jgi:hypothetical protein
MHIAYNKLDQLAQLQLPVAHFGGKKPDPQTLYIINSIKYHQKNTKEKKRKAHWLPLKNEQ